MYVLPLHIMILTVYIPPPPPPEKEPKKEPRQKQNISHTTKKALQRKQWNHQ